MRAGGFILCPVKYMTLEWEQLHNSVTGAVLKGHIGRPRSLRFTAHLGDSAGDLAKLTEAVTNSCSEWFGSDTSEVLQSVSRCGLEVVMLAWENGATALLSFSSVEGTRPGGDFTLLGTEGAIYQRLGGGQA